MTRIFITMVTHQETLMHLNDERRWPTPLSLKQVLFDWKSLQISFLYQEMLIILIIEKLPFWLCLQSCSYLVFYLVHILVYNKNSLFILRTLYQNKRIFKRKSSWEFYWEETFRFYDPKATGHIQLLAC